MRISEAVRLALAEIKQQKLRSVFTLLGVGIGVMFLIAVVSIVEGMGRYMKDDIVGKLLPINTFNLRATPDNPIGSVDQATWLEWQRRPNITSSDVSAVLAGLPTNLIAAVLTKFDFAVRSRYVPTPKTVKIHSVTSQYFTITKLSVTEGRVFTEQEDAMGAPVVVIGADVASYFFPSVDPLGRELRVGNIPYTVIGVAASQGNVFGQSRDGFVIAPLRSPLKQLANRHGTVDGMMTQAPDEQSMLAAEDAVQSTMRSLRKLKPEQTDNFVVETSTQDLAFWRKIRGYILAAGVILPLVAIIVAAIVVMNIMMVAVVERTPEIGLRKALGASRGDILAQFLAEAVVLSTAGSAIGVLAGFASAITIAAVSPLPTHVAPWSVFVSVTVGASVGIAAGILPAMRASQLDPVVALRAE